MEKEHFYENVILRYHSMEEGHIYGLMIKIYAIYEIYIDIIFVLIYKRRVHLHKKNLSKKDTSTEVPFFYPISQLIVP